MASTFRYLALESDRDLVVDWFRTLPDRPVEVQSSRALVLHFAALGPLIGSPGPIDSKRSPVATLFSPSPRRGGLWTAGEVHFLTVRVREQFPPLHHVIRRFRAWLQQFPCVHSRTATPGDWDYYLEGSIRNFDSNVFALPSAMDALR